MPLIFFRRKLTDTISNLFNTDPYWSNVVLLLHMNGSSFDSSSYQHQPATDTLEYSAFSNIGSGSANWTEVHPFVLLDNDTQNLIGTEVMLSSSVFARYVRVRMYNDGRYGQTNYTELFAAKLFYILTKDHLCHYNI